MLTRKSWTTGAGNTLQYKTGFFLFGFIPLYIKQFNITGHQVDGHTLQANLR